MNNHLSYKMFDMSLIFPYLHSLLNRYDVFEFENNLYIDNIKMTIDGFKTHKILITHVYFDRIKNELYYFNYRMHDMHVYTIDMDIAIVKLIRYVKGDFALDIQYDLILDLAAIDIDTADLLELISLDNVSISYNIIDLT